MGRILLVEDDALLGDGVKAGLEDDGHVVEWVRDGRLGREALAVESFAAVILDQGLPRMDGLQVLREIRARGDRTPVLVLTARDTVEQRVQGLDAGADDYLMKPFDLGELKARLRAIVRRSARQATNTLRCRGVELRLDDHLVSRDGEPVSLAPREFALLEALMSQPGRTFTRTQLEERLYPWGAEVESNAIEVHVHHLRAKLFPGLIRTVRGVGYALAAPDDG
jgi:DNA-binding response OmpR family regulator